MKSTSPLFERAARSLAETLPRQYRPGERLPPEPKLCRQLNLSITTLREALAVLHMQGIIEKRRGSGNYYIGVSGHRHIALLLPWPRMPLKVSPNLQESTRHLTRGLHKMQRSFRIYLGHDVGGERGVLFTFPELEEAVRKGEVAMVLNPAGRASDETLQLLKEAAVPICGYAPFSTTRVMHDIPGGIRHAIEWLASQGRVHIAYMDSLSAWEANTSTQKERFSAYCAGLHAIGQPVRPEWVQQDFHPLWSGAGWSNFSELWSALPEKPQALILSDETFLPDVLSALRDLKIETPRQLQIISQCTRGYGALSGLPLGYIENDSAAYARCMLAQVETFDRTGTIPATVEKVATLLETSRLEEAPATLPAPEKHRIMPPAVVA
ncbi:MAG TPA: GntR family transcriptional regulator [Chthoniobacteraceae bacterium]|nr:GntR family transcriptional regulator [Chthoniobacteraceae bacterium]